MSGPDQIVCPKCGDWYFEEDLHLCRNANKSARGTINSSDAEPKLVVTPEQLRKMSKWFDDPKNVFVSVTAQHQLATGPMQFTAGYLLRRIADAMLAARKGAA